MKKILLLAMLLLASCSQLENLSDPLAPATSEEKKQKIQAPEVSPAAGTYSEKTNVAIKPAKENKKTKAPLFADSSTEIVYVEDAIIKYTTDGSDPLTSPTALIGTNVTVESNTILRVCAVKDGYDPSDVVQADYIITTGTLITNIDEPDPVITNVEPTPTNTPPESTNVEPAPVVPPAINMVAVSNISIAYSAITESQWNTVRVWATNNGYSFSTFENKTFSDIIKWCNALSEMSGMKPRYTQKSVVWKNTPFTIKENETNYVNYPIYMVEGSGYSVPYYGLNLSSVEQVDIECLQYFTVSNMISPKLTAGGFIGFENKLIHKSAEFRVVLQ